MSTPRQRLPSEPLRSEIAHDSFNGLFLPRDRSRETDCPARLREMCLQCAVSVVANVPEIFRKAKDSPDLIEKPDSLVLVTTHPQLNGSKCSLLDLMSHRLTGYGRKHARNAEDLQRKFVEKT